MEDTSVFYQVKKVTDDHSIDIKILAKDENVLHEVLEDLKR